MIALRLGALAMLFAASSAQAQCLEYEPAKVTLSGIISQREDFGPPGYGEDPKHDSKEDHLLLTLDHPVCVSAAKNVYNSSETNVTVMQMAYFTHSPFQREWLGKHVLVTGTLFHGHTGHHVTAVLIEPTETKLVSP